MMYMEDAIKATMQIMEVPTSTIKIRSSYNLAALSFNPKEIAESIQQHLPDFTITYEPDFRQAIADSWPESIDDTSARDDWGWKHQYNLEAMTKIMLDNLRK